MWESVPLKAFRGWIDIFEMGSKIDALGLFRFLLPVRFFLLLFGELTGVEVVTDSAFTDDAFLALRRFIGDFFVIEISGTVFMLLVADAGNAVIS